MKYAATPAIAALVALSLGCASPAFAGSNGTIANGDMEDISRSNVNKWMPDSWTPLVKGGEGLNTFGSQPSPDGGNYFGIQYVTGWNDLGDGHARFNVGGISQDISGLTIGDTYTISFWSMANHTDDPKASEYWAVSFGGTTLNATTVDAKNSGKWVQDTLSFVATATTQTLTFAAKFLNATPGATPEVLNLDGITISHVSAVPEPAQAALWTGGLLALGCVVARRRKSQR